MADPRVTLNPGDTSDLRIGNVAVPVNADEATPRQWILDRLDNGTEFPTSPEPGAGFILISERSANDQAAQTADGTRTIFDTGGRPVNPNSPLNTNTVVVTVNGTRVTNFTPEINPGNNNRIRVTFDTAPASGAQIFVQHDAGDNTPGIYFRNAANTDWIPASSGTGATINNIAGNWTVETGASGSVDDNTRTIVIPVSGGGGGGASLPRWTASTAYLVNSVFYTGDDVPVGFRNKVYRVVNTIDNTHTTFDTDIQGDVVVIGEQDTDTDSYRGIWASGSDYAEHELVYINEVIDAVARRILYVAINAINNSTTAPNLDTTNWARVGEPNTDTNTGVKRVRGDNYDSDTPSTELDYSTDNDGTLIVDGQRNINTLVLSNELNIDLDISDWAQATYDPGIWVTHNGQLWRSNAETTQEPSSTATQWDGFGGTGTAVSVNGTQVTNPDFDSQAEGTNRRTQFAADSDGNITVSVGEDTTKINTTNVETFARVDDNASVPVSKLTNVEAFARVGDTTQITDAKIPSTIARDTELFRTTDIVNGQLRFFSAGDTATPFETQSLSDVERPNIYRFDNLFDRNRGRQSNGSDIAPYLGLPAYAIVVNTFGDGSSAPGPGEAGDRTTYFLGTVPTGAGVITTVNADWEALTDPGRDITEVPFDYYDDDTDSYVEIEIGTEDSSGGGTTFTDPYINSVAQDDTTGVVTFSGSNGYTQQTIQGTNAVIQFTITNEGGVLNPDYQVTVGDATIQDPDGTNIPTAEVRQAITTYLSSLPLTEDLVSGTFSNNTLTLNRRDNANPIVITDFGTAASATIATALDTANNDNLPTTRLVNDGLNHIHNQASEDLHNQKLEDHANVATVYRDGGRTIPAANQRTISSAADDISFRTDNRTGITQQSFEDLTFRVATRDSDGNVTSGAMVAIFQGTNSFWNTTAANIRTNLINNNGTILWQGNVRAIQTNPAASVTLTNGGSITPPTIGNGKFAVVIEIDADHFDHFSDNSSQWVQSSDRNIVDGVEETTNIYGFVASRNANDATDYLSRIARIVEAIHLNDVTYVYRNATRSWDAVPISQFGTSQGSYPMTGGIALEGFESTQHTGQTSGGANSNNSWPTNTPTLFGETAGISYSDSPGPQATSLAGAGVLFNNTGSTIDMTNARMDITIEVTAITASQGSTTPRLVIDEVMSDRTLVSDSDYAFTDFGQDTISEPGTYTMSIGNGTPTPFTDAPIMWENTRGIAFVVIESNTAQRPFTYTVQSIQISFTGTRFEREAAAGGPFSAYTLDSTAPSGRFTFPSVNPATNVISWTDITSYEGTDNNQHQLNAINFDNTGRVLTLTDGSDTRDVNLAPTAAEVNALTGLSLNNPNIGQATAQSPAIFDGTTEAADATNQRVATTAFVHQAIDIVPVLHAPALTGGYTADTRYELRFNRRFDVGPVHTFRRGDIQINGVAPTILRNNVGTIISQAGESNANATFNISGTADSNTSYFIEYDSTQASALNGTATSNPVAYVLVSFNRPGGTGTPDRTLEGLILGIEGTVDLSTYARLASPAFTGTPTAPTAAAGTNTAQIATTAFVAANRGHNGITDDGTNVTDINWANDFQMSTTAAGADGVIAGNTVFLDAAGAETIFEVSNRVFITATNANPATDTEVFLTVTGSSGLGTFTDGTYIAEINGATTASSLVVDNVQRVVDGVITGGVITFGSDTGSANVVVTNRGVRTGTPAFLSLTTPADNVFSFDDNGLSLNGGIIGQTSRSVVDTGGMGGTIRYNSTTNRWEFLIGNTVVMSVGSDGLRTIDSINDPTPEN